MCSKVCTTVSLLMARVLRGDRLTWNLMGMMNNPHYRVKVHAATTPEGLLAMRFEHPCLAGGEAGGCALGCFCCVGVQGLGFTTPKGLLQCASSTPAWRAARRAGARLAIGAVWDLLQSLYVEPNGIGIGRM